MTGDSKDIDSAMFGLPEEDRTARVVVDPVTGQILRTEGPPPIPFVITPPPQKVGPSLPSDPFQGTAFSEVSHEDTIELQPDEYRERLHEAPEAQEWTLESRTTDSQDLPKIQPRPRTFLYVIIGVGIGIALGSIMTAILFFALRDSFTRDPSPPRHLEAAQAATTQPPASKIRENSISSTSDPSFSQPISALPMDASPRTEKLSIVEPALSGQLPNELPLPIRFDAGRAEASSFDEAQLRNIAEMILEQRGAQIEIVGFALEGETEPRNVEHLAYRRAKVAIGIISSYGPSRRRFKLVASETTKSAPLDPLVLLRIRPVD